MKQTKKKNNKKLCENILLCENEIKKYDGVLSYVAGMNVCIMCMCFYVYKLNI